MSENKQPSLLDPEDDAPDLSTPHWQAEFAKAPLRRGRPKLDDPKVLTTIRLDPDVLAFFQKDGDGWQTRINSALRKLALKPASNRSKALKEKTAKPASADAKRAATLPTFRVAEKRNAK